MIIFEKYTGEKTYLFPTSRKATKEAVLESYPGALEFVHVVQTDDFKEVMYGFYTLSSLKSRYNIDPTLTEEEAIALIQEIVNTPAPEIIEEEVITPEERIAACMEYQMLMSMEDVEDTTEGEVE